MTLLYVPSIPKVAHKRIEPLLVVLDQISKAAEEEEGDPFSSTFEALRVMQTTISKFNGGGSPSRDISASSSEYTTPVQSHSTSPTHEHSPPPPGIPIPSDTMFLGSLLGFALSSSEQSSMGPSPSTSPTHGSTVSSLATHSFVASRSGEESSGGWNRTSPPTQSHGAGGSNHSKVEPGSPRRLSDPDVHRHGVRPRQYPPHLQPSHGYSKSIDATFK